MPGAVSGGVDVGIAGAGVLIDQDTVIDSQARLLRQGYMRG